MRGPAVDLFLRNLFFEFSRERVVGVSGGLIGIEEPRQDASLIWFFHEVEHLTQLTHPLGVILTALPLRALDLRNDAVKTFSAWDFRNESVEEILDACRRHRELVLAIHVVSDWMQPLLEGLAMVTEFELDHLSGETIRPPASSAIFAEYYNLNHRLMATAEGRRALAGLDASDERLWNEIFGFVERQTRVSRDIRRDGDLLDEVFWGAGDADATWPYFIGYFYVRQLMQRWHGKIDDNSPERLHDRISKAICSVIPMTALPVMVPVGTVDTLGAQVLSSVLELLAGRVHQFVPSDIARIGEGLWKIDASNRLELLLDPAHVERRDGHDPVLLFLVGEMLEHVFGMQEATAEHQQTADALYDLEWGKFVVPAFTRKVLAAALSTDGTTLLLVDERMARELGGRLPAIGLTYFAVEPEVLRELARTDEFDLDSLPRVDLREPGPYRVTTGPRWQLQLGTYVHFWPHGVEEAVPLKLIRVLVNSHKHAMYEDGTTPDDRRARATREEINRRWQPRLAEATDVQRPAIAALIERLEEIVDVSSVAGSAGRRLLASYAEEREKLRRRIRADLAKLVFGNAIDTAELQPRRLAVLADELSNDDLAVLRRALRGGLILTRDCATAVRTDSRDAVERIRAAAMRRLGVPLVRWIDDDPPSVALDVLAPA